MNAPPPAPDVPTAVAVSPHLDDAVFSAGGILALLARAGWRVRVVTCFTASVDDPGPFALSTQLDKGLAADVDYMALRRAEDRAAQRALGTSAPVHLPLPEAPHRGYGSAPELFTPPHPDDPAGTELPRLLAPHLAAADLVLAPLGIGDHVDHLLTARAVAATVPYARVGRWRDVPYIARAAVRAADRDEAGAAAELTADIGAVLTAKTAAARCYATQLGFQFGGSGRTGEVLSAVARSEAARAGAPYVHGETLQAGETARRLLRAGLFAACRYGRYGRYERMERRIT
ncbi:LmbE family N-acetylglucosaminyl deacetylase [Streptomyces sp. V3I8]|uniref:PIG-L deacetylase family protein n=1 Tax=Streptomyces sp. V3I8 TaxID=3042279 RepID=UPI002789C24B|nr:PIG-L family deacetylase [Streptomyces sp. V3I8]MDQ1033797.1 LmbE family N-acetylglucosaminyl deacetylase [Streptomyces sp. V3I8]